ncbi:MAG TPA: hypothetical protein VFO18_05300 [Methylomirabilota bacterium]|nr:hypothetical protein [Methylomirabilota bacterium]
MTFALLLLGGCASGAQSCPARKTGGWLSGWGSGGSSAFTLGVRRTFGDCEERAATPGGPPANLGPVPSADPASEPTEPRTPATGASTPR